MIKHIPKKKFLLLIGDILLIYFACVVAPAIRFQIPIFEPLTQWPEILTIMITCLLFFYIADFYNFEAGFTNIKYAIKYLATLAIASGTILIIFFLFPMLRLDRGVFAVNAILISILIYLWRFVFEKAFKRFMPLRQKVFLIIGAGKAGYAIYKQIKGYPNVRVAGFIDDDTKKINKHNNPMLLGGYEELTEIVKREDVDQIIIAVKEINNTELLKNLLNCKMKGIEIYNIQTFYEQTFGKIEVDYVTDPWLINIPIMGIKKSLYNKNIKRVIGIMISVVFLVIGLPIIFLVAIAIKIDSKGPVFYKQIRVGLNGQLFKLVKFRSMTVDAEKNGAIWALKNDHRVTRVGKIIRKLRIDEIPQMWNVLVGDMNFFGPRPERPEFVEMLKEKIPYYDLRHTVKPGITGWAQVNYPYGASVEDALEKLKYDLFYIKNLSPFLDFHILLRTIRVVLFGKGAR